VKVRQGVASMTQLDVVNYYTRLTAMDVVRAEVLDGLRVCVAIHP